MPALWASLAWRAGFDSRQGTPASAQGVSKLPPAALGLGGALLITRALTGLLYRTSPHDPATLALVTVGLVGVALTASFLPAWRAARVAPLDALRQSGE